MMINKVILIGLAIILLLVLVQPYLMTSVKETFQDDINMCPVNLKTAKLQLEATSNDLLSCKNDKINIQVDLNEKINTCLNDKIIQQQRIDSKLQEVSSAKEDILMEKQRYGELQKLYEREKLEKNELVDKLSKINQEASVYTTQVIQLQKQLETCNNSVANMNNNSNSIQQGNSDMLEMNQKLIKDYNDLSKKYNVYCYEYNISLKKNQKARGPPPSEPAPVDVTASVSKAAPTSAPKNNTNNDQFGSADGVSATDLANPIL